MTQVEFVVTRKDRQGNNYSSMFIDGKLSKENIISNYQFGIDQRAINVINEVPDVESVTDVKGDNLDSFNKNLTYLLTLFNVYPSFQKKYKHSYKELKHIL